MKETMKNLAKAFIGESQARNRYRIYSKVAKKEGFEQISAIFLETAENEWEHANTLFKLIVVLNVKPLLCVMPVAVISCGKKLKFPSILPQTPNSPPKEEFWFWSGEPSSAYTLTLYVPCRVG